MSSKLLLKSSGTASAVPDFDDLELAELVVNTRDGKLFCKTYDGATYAIVDLTLSSPDEIIASGPGLIGRSASGSGPAALLSGSNAVALLPAATASNDGKMPAAAAAALAKAVFVSDDLVVPLSIVSSQGTTTSTLDNDNNNQTYVRRGCRAYGSTVFCRDLLQGIVIPSNIKPNEDIRIDLLLSQDPDGAGEDMSIHMLYEYAIIGQIVGSATLIERYIVNNKTGNTPWIETFYIPFVSGQDRLYISIIKNGVSYAITGIDQNNKKIVLSTSDSREQLIPGMHITVTGSNAGTYTIASVGYTTSTEVTVSESLPSATVDGTVNCRDTVGFELKCHEMTAIIKRT